VAVSLQPAPQGFPHNQLVIDNKDFSPAHRASL
jgi:hypothetical protein